MKKQLYALVVIILLVLGASLTLAFGPRWGNNALRSAYHERMQEVLENGTYEDLVALREETGMPMLYWVDSEQEFAQVQERYQAGNISYRSYGRGCMWG